MTISSNDRRKEYPGNGVTTVFNGPRAFSASHVKVYLVNDTTGQAVEQTGGAYTLTGVGKQATTVTMGAAPATGETLLVLRTVPYEQDTDISNQGAFLPEIHENAFDKRVMQIQQLADAIARALVASETSTGDNWNFDAQGRRIINLGNAIDPGDAVNLLTLFQQLGEFEASGLNMEPKYWDLAGADGVETVFFIPGADIAAPVFYDVFVNGVAIEPEDGYSIQIAEDTAGSTITFVTPPDNLANVWVVLRGYARPLSTDYLTTILNSSEFLSLLSQTITNTLYETTNVLELGPVRSLIPLADVAGTAQTVDGTHESYLLRCTNAAATTLTVRANTGAANDWEANPIAAPYFSVKQHGAGQVTLAADTGVTITPPPGYLAKTRAQGSIVTATADYIAGGQWTLSGDLALDPDYVPGGGGGGTTLPTGYATYLAASLEPDALEALQYDTFSYAVNASTTKLLMASWQTRIGSTGRMEARNPQGYVPLRGVTLTGTGAGSSALILDPAAPTYTDPWTTYYNRLELLHELPTRVIPLASAGEAVPLLPGPYGAIITHITSFNFAWTCWRAMGPTGPGFNLMDEESDAAPQRVGIALRLPISKRTAGELEASAASTTSDGAPGSALCMVLCPADWSAVTDPLTYVFRDDFMGAALDTGVWTRAESTVGNVEINTTYQWCKLAGNTAWGGNGLYRATGTAREAGRYMMMDVFMPRGASGTGVCMLGWSDGGGHSFSNLAHGINFAGGVSPGGIINVYENSNNRGEVGAGWTAGCIYRVRITLTATGAVYEIQGGREYPAIGGSSWTNITPGTTSSATATLHAAAVAYANTAYVSDARIV